MTKIPQTIFLQAKDFHSAWSRLIRSNILNGTNLVIGDKDDPKSISDICALTELSGNAINQILNHELHQQFPFKMIQQYVDQFTYEWQNKNGTGGFDYTYFNRLTQYNTKTIYGITVSQDQLTDLRWGLGDQIIDEISSNRNQVITWIPEIDSESSNPPCLQNIWIRYLGNNQVEVHWHFRSRDLFTAWQANIIALTDMINRYVIQPNNCRIVKIVDYCDSLHIYKSDMGEAEKVKLIGVNPQ